MTEDDFILATNLARVRLAIHAVAELYAGTARDRASIGEVVRTLSEMERRWDEKLEKRKAPSRWPCGPLGDEVPLDWCPPAADENCPRRHPSTPRRPRDAPIVPPDAADAS